LAIVPDHLDQIAATAAKDEEVARMRIGLQHRLDLGRKTVEAATHVADPTGQVHT
jgi:hypothetical protein